jgi:hypothetical protein
VEFLVGFIGFLPIYYGFFGRFLLGFLADLSENGGWGFLVGVFGST